MGVAMRIISDWRNDELPEIEATKDSQQLSPTSGRVWLQGKKTPGPGGETEADLDAKYQCQRPACDHVAMVT
jgi:hypothetical protein